MSDSLDSKPVSVPSIIILQTADQEYLLSCLKDMKGTFETLAERTFEETFQFLNFFTANEAKTLIDPEKPQLFITGTFHGSQAPAVELARSLKQLSAINLSCWGLTGMEDFPAEIFDETIKKLRDNTLSDLIQLIVLFLQYEKLSLRERNHQRFAGFYLDRTLEMRKMEAFKKEHVGL